MLSKRIIPKEVAVYGNSKLSSSTMARPFKRADICLIYLIRLLFIHWNPWCPHSFHFSEITVFGVTFLTLFHLMLQVLLRHAVAQMVEALCYKPKGRGFDSRWGRWIFNWPNPSSRTMTLWSTKPLIGMITRNVTWDKGRPAPKADTSPPSVSRMSRKCGSLGAS
jgi:hypothetical protein